MDYVKALKHDETVNNLIKFEVDNRESYKSRLKGHQMDFIHCKEDEDELAQKIVDVLVGSLLSKH